MINYHYIETQSAKLATPNDTTKEPFLRATYHEQLATKKQNTSEATNRILETHHYHEPITNIKLGKPLRVVMAKHSQTSEKKLLQSVSIDSFLPHNIYREQPQEKEQQTHKMGSRIRQKMNGELEESPNSSNKEQNNPASTSISTLGQSLDDHKLVEFKEWVSSEISKLNQKVKMQDDKLQKMEKLATPAEQNHAFNGPQIEELNRILSLVEKAGNREDYKRTTRMIEELRADILELHQELSDLTHHNYKSSLHTIQPIDSYKTDSRQLQNQLGVVQKMMQECKKQEDSLRAVFQAVQNTKRDVQAMISGSPYKRGFKQFKGKIISFQYQQRLIPCHPNPPISLQASNKEEVQPNIVEIASHVYYLDSDGYLLDSEGFYLLTDSEQQIRLTSRELQLLKANHIL